MTTCPVCDGSMQGRRPSARYCSAACKQKAWRRSAGCPGADQDARVTPGRHDRASVTVTPSEAAQAGVIELGRVSGDTIDERRWRVVNGDGYRLEVEAMVSGRWKAVLEAADLPAIVRRAGWLGLRFETRIGT